VIFSPRLVSGYSIPGLSATRRLARGLLAPSLSLHRYDTTVDQFSLVVTLRMV
jgi:hypothetical protein